ncbi:MAG TPA: osmotically inducible protein OsmC [Actinobacteria bacterium]|nr:osmotically inducible protein OsmC [Actinomycetota bacterium]
MDSLPEVGGEGVGIKPIELLLIALAGCTAMDVISIMKKKRQDVREFSIEVEGTQREDFPKSFREIKLVYRIKGENIDEEALKRAIELSEEKYCSVRMTILGMPETASITYSYEIES